MRTRSLIDKNLVSLLWTEHAMMSGEWWLDKKEILRHDEAEIVFIELQLTMAWIFSATAPLSLMTLFCDYSIHVITIAHLAHCLGICKFAIPKVSKLDLRLGKQLFLVRPEFACFNRFFNCALYKSMQS